MNPTPDDKISKIAWITILVASLGYFVDVFDMWLFANFRIQSLRDLGLNEKEVTEYGALLMNTQQMGFLLGGLIWGVLGDKRGRASVMFGSILLYSVCNLLNAYITDINSYIVLRFITGFGLAGEIGVGITLVCELLPKGKRGIGTTIVSTLGVAGAIFAGLAGKYLEWRNAFFIGGLMGLALLVLRIITHESGMFNKMLENKEIKKGSLKLLLGSKDRAYKLIACVLVGAPIYFSFGILFSFAPEISKALGILDPVSVPDAMLCGSIGITIGDLLAGTISQILKSRKIPLFILMTLSFLFSGILLAGPVMTSSGYILLCGFIGLFTGYWACLLTMSAEQFGTNLRSTVTTMVPNIVRATTIPMISGFVYLKSFMDTIPSLFTIFIIVYLLSFISLIKLKDTFHKDLDFYE